MICRPPGRQCARGAQLVLAAAVSMAAFAAASPGLAPLPASADQLTRVNQSRASAPPEPTTVQEIVGGSVTLNGQRAPNGTVVQVYCTPGTVTGETKVEQTGQRDYVVTVYGADANTPGSSSYCKDGQTMQFLVNGVAAAAAPRPGSSTAYSGATGSSAVIDLAATGTGQPAAAVSTPLPPTSTPSPPATPSPTATPVMAADTATPAPTAAPVAAAATLTNAPSGEAPPVPPPREAVGPNVLVVAAGSRGRLDLPLAPGVSVGVTLASPPEVTVEVVVQPGHVAEALSAWPALRALVESGLGDARRVFGVAVFDRATGRRFVEQATPLALTINYDGDDLAAAGGDPSLLRLVILRPEGESTPACPPGSFVAAPAVEEQTRTLVVQTACTSLFVVTALTGVSAELDYDVPSGHFFAQASGTAGRGGVGYRIEDDGGAALWREFQRLGGVTVLGYPAGRRSLRDAFPVQLTQRFVLQWRPERGEVWFANVFDELHDRGYDGFLESMRQIPPPFDTAPDAGLEFGAIVRQHLDQVLSGRDLRGQPVPDIDLTALVALRERFLTNPEWLTQYGLPMGIGRFPASIVVRAQRAAFQYWLVDQPFAMAGEITLVLGGDISKEAGLWTLEETAPELPPARQS